MGVAAVIFREESQLENLHDHLQGDKEQGKEQEPLENSKESLEQNQLPQLSEHETYTKSDESNHSLTSKTAKATEVHWEKHLKRYSLKNCITTLTTTPNPDIVPTGMKTTWHKYKLLS